MTYKLEKINLVIIAIIKCCYYQRICSKVTISNIQTIKKYIYKFIIETDTFNSYIKSYNFDF